MSSNYINYVPHNKFEHRETKGEWTDQYIMFLSRDVNAACDRFFRSRGLERPPTLGITRKKPDEIPES